MKRKTTREILAESFRELASGKDTDKITVQEIVSNCGYSTATFYRHFRDKYDLIAWDHAQNVAGIMNRINPLDYPWKQTLTDGIRLFEQEADYLTNLFLHTAGHDSFIRNMTDINHEALRAYILRSTGKKTLDQKTDMYLRFYCLGSVCLICEWILGQHKMTADEIVRVLENSLPAPLHPYLLGNERI